MRALNPELAWCRGLGSGEGCGPLGVASNAAALPIREAWLGPDELSDVSCGVRGLWLCESGSTWPVREDESRQKTLRPRVFKAQPIH